MREIDYLFEIDKNSLTQISTQIYEHIKAEILSGRYKFGDKLPSVRTSAKNLNVSNSSIISAFFQLTTEGFTENVPYKGYFVCNIAKIKNEKSNYELEFIENNISYINDAIDYNAFPREIWKKNYSKILYNNDIDLTITGDEQGELELRQAIADFVRIHRGCNTSPEQIIVASGIQTLVSMLIRITSGEYSTVFLEYPSYKKVEYVFNDYKIPVKKLKVYDDGINIDELNNMKKMYIYTSPSYQYPLGNLMSVGKRYELIEYANKNNCLILEDDYASIIRYDSKPISSLQGLDIYDNTVYFGSFSKTFLPSLRISFMVLPKKCLPKYYEIKSKYTHTCSKLEQLCLAQIIKNGYMEKHLKRINNIYKQKNQLITKYIKDNYKNRLTVHNSQSGFHIILSCKTDRDISFMQDFKDQFLLIDIIEFINGNLTFLFSYSGLTLTEIPKITDIIARILGLNKEN